MSIESSDTRLVSLILQGERTLQRESADPRQCLELAGRIRQELRSSTNSARSCVCATAEEVKIQLYERGGSVRVDNQRTNLNDSYNTYQRPSQ